MVARSVRTISTSDRERGTVAFSVKTGKFSPWPREKCEVVEKLRNQQGVKDKPRTASSHMDHPRPMIPQRSVRVLPGIVIWTSPLWANDCSVTLKVCSQGESKTFQWEDGDSIHQAEPREESTHGKDVNLPNVLTVLSWFTCQLLVFFFSSAEIFLVAAVNSFCSF